MHIPTNPSSSEPRLASSSARGRRGALVAAVAVAVSLAAPALAAGSSISLEGDVLVVRAAPGEKNWIDFGPAYEPGRLRVSDTALPVADPAVCAHGDWDSWNATTCVVPPGGIRVDAGDGDDIVNSGENLPSTFAVTVDGGPGADVLRGAASTPTAERLLGGEGPDKLTGGPGADQVEGGPGDDKVEGQDGDDTVRGGDGSDTLRGDGFGEQGADVLDGGAGLDQIDGDWSVVPGQQQPPVTVSQNGVADDGRPGEGDAVSAVERIALNIPATLVGSDGPDELSVFNTDELPSALSGRGGDDRLTGFDYADTVDGGEGADRLVGGFGDDTLTGGPGRDTIAADADGTTCTYIQCRLPQGNDTVLARDGEVDSIDCGVGNDTVAADPIDVIAPNCEKVDVGSAGRPGDVGPGDSVKPGDVGDGRNGGNLSDRPSGRGRAAVRLTALRARRHGRRLVIAGRVGGEAARVTVVVRRGARRITRTTAKVRAGRFTARLKVPTRGGLRATVTAGGTSRVLRVR